MMQFEQVRINAYRHESFTGKYTNSFKTTSETPNQFEIVSEIPYSCDTVGREL